MVRALLAGTKTQTRRIVKPQPPEWAQHVNAMTHLNVEHRWVPSYVWQWSELETGKKLRRWPTDPDGDGADGYAIPCPYGKPGDRLWVRETTSESEPRFLGGKAQPTVWYRADNNRPMWADRKWTPSILSPRRLSRITLEITGVRVERLQAISETDARAEGITDGGCLACGGNEPCGCASPTPDARDSYAALWESINGDGAWALNPWVWCVSFKRVVQP